MEIKITPADLKISPEQIYKWHTVERIARETAESFGFHETRIPTFENTNLFLRSVGETTDVVQKEMYTVTAKETQFTLRPEGTAGTIRSMLQNGLLNDALPQKVFYILSCFRHERPQKGRLREFHQFGVEMAGSQGPASDAEIISLAKTILDRAGLQNIALNIIHQRHCLPCGVSQGSESLLRTEKRGTLRNLPDTSGKEPHADSGLQEPDLCRNRQMLRSFWTISATTAAHTLKNCRNT